MYDVHQKSLLLYRFLGTIHKGSGWVGLGQRPGICLANQFLGDAGGFGLCTNRPAIHCLLLGEASSVCQDPIAIQLSHKSLARALVEVEEHGLKKEFFYTSFFD